MIPCVRPFLARDGLAKGEIVLSSLITLTQGEQPVLHCKLTLMKAKDFVNGIGTKVCRSWLENILFVESGRHGDDPDSIECPDASSLTLTQGNANFTAWQVLVIRDTTTPPEFKSFSWDMNIWLVFDETHLAPLAIKRHFLLKLKASFRK
jgi:hypothetical protein